MSFSRWLGALVAFVVAVAAIPGAQAQPAWYPTSGAQTCAETWPGTTLDPTKWSSFPAQTAAPNSQVAEAELPQNTVNLTPGIAIVSKHQQFKATASHYNSYTSGYLIGRNGPFGCGYQAQGYFQSVVQLPYMGAAVGSWPAFWLLPEDGSTDFELDVMERFNVSQTQNAYATLHWNNYGAAAGATGLNSALLCTAKNSGQFATAQHTFAVDVEPGTIQVFYDGASCSSPLSNPTGIYTTGGVGLYPYGMTSGGSGYTNGGPYAMAFTGGGCTTEPAGTFNVSGGSVYNPVLTGIGGGCTSLPTLSFAAGGGGSGASIAEFLMGYAGVTVKLSNVGSGYTNGTYAFGATGGTGTGLAGTYTTSGGFVSTIQVTNAGNYSVAPTLTFPSGGGTGAAATTQIMLPGSRPMYPLWDDYVGTNVNHAWDVGSPWTYTISSYSAYRKTSDTEVALPAHILNCSTDKASYNPGDTVAISCPIVTGGASRTSVGFTGNVFDFCGDNSTGFSPCMFPATNNTFGTSFTSTSGTIAANTTVTQTATWAVPTTIKQGIYTGEVSLSDASLDADGTNFRIVVGHGQP